MSPERGLRPLSRSMRSDRGGGHPGTMGWAGWRYGLNIWPKVARVIARTDGGPFFCKSRALPHPVRPRQYDRGRSRITQDQRSGIVLAEVPHCGVCNTMREQPRPAPPAGSRPARARQARCASRAGPSPLPPRRWFRCRPLAQATGPDGGILTGSHRIHRAASVAGRRALRREYPTSSVTVTFAPTRPER